MRLIRALITRDPGSQIFGPGPHFLTVNGEIVAPAAVAITSAARRRGLLGSVGIIGALWITRCPSVHMVGMSFPIDVAVVNKRGVVLAVASLTPPWGMTRWRWRASVTVEMPVGALALWGIHPGTRLTICERDSGRTLPAIR
ncbi:MAG: DUF192 domain-containing protein [Actinomycetota bacterium]